MNHAFDLVHKGWGQPQNLCPAVASMLNSDWPRFVFFLNYFYLLVFCLFLLPHFSWFSSPHLEVFLYKFLGRIALWWNRIATLSTSLPIWVYFCSDIDLACRAVDSYMLNSFQVVPQAQPTKGNQAKDTLVVFRRHILESLKTEKAARTSRSGDGARMAA